MSAHGGVIAYGATFLIFSDYQRPTLRLAALMRVPSIFVYTHDSIGLGEDGPTHQPIEQLASMRAIPDFVTLRPADANETAAAWRLAIERGGAVALVFTRQGLPVLDATQHDIRAGVEHGAYAVVDPDDGTPDVILIATGSEVSLAMEAAEALAGEGVRARVVSMPSQELFRAQSDEYRSEVLPRDVPKLAIEAASPFGWREFVGDDGGVIGLERFGASAPGSVAMERLGFNVDNVVTHARALLSERAARVTGGA
jgi:transketolase